MGDNHSIRPIALLCEKPLNIYSLKNGIYLFFFFILNQNLYELRISLTFQSGKVKIVCDALSADNGCHTWTKHLLLFVLPGVGTRNSQINFPVFSPPRAVECRVRLNVRRTSQTDNGKKYFFSDHRPAVRGFSPGRIITVITIIFITIVIRWSFLVYSTGCYSAIMSLFTFTVIF